jgi:ribonuclease BN (tRNA processing enzyme)
VAAGSTSLWLDAGPGTFANLQWLADPAQVDAVVVSHEHPDHCADLDSYAVWLHHVAHPPVRVYAPPGVRHRSYHAQDPVLEWIEIEPAMTVTIGDLTCTFAGTDHGPPTVAVRFDAAGAGAGADALTYSADTGPDWSVAELGTGIGTLLCEASYTKEHEGELRHLSGRQAGSMAARAAVGQLVLTHRWPTVAVATLADEAAEAFGREVEQAHAGRILRW